MKKILSILFILLIPLQTVLCSVSEEILCTANQQEAVVPLLFDSGEYLDDIFSSVHSHTRKKNIECDVDLMWAVVPLLLSFLPERKTGLVPKFRIIALIPVASRTLLQKQCRLLI